LTVPGMKGREGGGKKLRKGGEKRRKLSKKRSRFKIVQGWVDPRANSITPFKPGATKRLFRSPSQERKGGKGLGARGKAHYRRNAEKVCFRQDQVSEREVAKCLIIGASNFYGRRGGENAVKRGGTRPDADSSSNIL